jgi:hypothetical protein
MSDPLNKQEMSGMLNDTWILWAHLPHDTDWSLKSYKQIMTIRTVGDIVCLYNIIPGKMTNNCMLFLMREGIEPRWEDEKNRDGGCFSFKVGNKQVHNVWENISYSVVGETMCKKIEHCKVVTGITISPKRAFCIIKIWLSDCNHQSSTILADVPEVSKQGCLFKKHNP